MVNLNGSMPEPGEPTNDEADLEFLAAQGAPFYRIPVGMRLEPKSLHLAFMRSVLADWVRLIDIEPGIVPGPGGRQQQGALRVFHRTMLGDMRLSALRAGVKSNINVASPSEKAN